MFNLKWKQERPFIHIFALDPFEGAPISPMGRYPMILCPAPAGQGVRVWAWHGLEGRLQEPALRKTTM